MAATAGPAAGSRFGFTSGQEIQEFGYDDDVDAEVRTAVEGVTGNGLVDEDYSDVVDGAPPSPTRTVRSGSPGVDGFSTCTL